MTWNDQDKGASVDAGRWQEGRTIVGCLDLLILPCFILRVYPVVYLTMHKIDEIDEQSYIYQQVYDS